MQCIITLLSLLTACWKKSIIYMEIRMTFLHDNVMNACTYHYRKMFAHNENMQKVLWRMHVCIKVLVHMHQILLYNIREGGHTKKISREVFQVLRMLVHVHMSTREWKFLHSMLGMWYVMSRWDITTQVIKFDHSSHSINIYVCVHACQYIPWDQQSPSMWVGARRCESVCHISKC